MIGFQDICYSQIQIAEQQLIGIHELNPLEAAYHYSDGVHKLLSIEIEENDTGKKVFFTFCELLE